jgi:hypothetical protein
MYIDSLALRSFVGTQITVHQNVDNQIIDIKM